MVTQFETHDNAHENRSSVANSDWYRRQLEEATEPFGSPIVAMEAWYSSDECQELLRRGE